METEAIRCSKKDHVYYHLYDNIVFYYYLYYYLMCIPNQKTMEYSLNHLLKHSVSGLDYV